MIPLAILDQWEAIEVLRKNFVTDLKLCEDQSQNHGGSQQILCQRCVDIFSNTNGENWRQDLGTFDKLNDSADTGCPLCVLLKEAVASISTAHAGSLDNFLLSIDWDRSRMTIEQCFNGHSKQTWIRNPVVHAELDMFVDKEDPASSIIQGRPDIEDFTSDQTFELIRNWLHECANSKYHDTCRTNLSHAVPLRLLDVGKEGDTDITISHNHGVVGYISLSYCWGGPQDVVLTAEDLKQNSIVFEVRNLPATIQDAIFVTRKLGVRYLWIDALCIVQKGDNGRDFTIQAPKMDSVYGSSLATIAAASTSSVRDGILSSCQTPNGRNRTINLQYELAGTQNGKITISTRNRLREYEAEPLLSRCWTLQERALSQRVISFHKNHLTWNCRNAYQSSDGVFWPQTDLSYLLPSIIPREFFTATEKPTTKIPRFWRLCVEDYSGRVRTAETDKLTALAGVARRIHKQSGDVYLAGLWRSDIKVQLCWRTVADTSQRPVWPSCYLAPSWSWASLNCKVKFLEPSDNKWCWRIQLLDAKTTPLSESSPFSEVTDGWLLLQGKLKKARTRYTTGGILSALFPGRNARWAVALEKALQDDSYLLSIMDGRRVIDRKDFCEFYWLWIHSNQSNTILLLLEATDKEGIFKRVGSIELKVGSDDFLWFEDVNLQNITIV